MIEEDLVGEAVAIPSPHASVHLLWFLHPSRCQTDIFHRPNLSKTYLRHHDCGSKRQLKKLVDIWHLVLHQLEGGAAKGEVEGVEEESEACQEAREGKVHGHWARGNREGVHDG